MQKLIVERSALVKKHRAYLITVCEVNKQGFWCPAYGSVCRWWSQTHSSWTTTTLHQTQGEWEEQKTFWTFRYTGIQPG